MDKTPGSRVCRRVQESRARVDGGSGTHEHPQGRDADDIGFTTPAASPHGQTGLRAIEEYLRHTRIAGTIIIFAQIQDDE